MQPSSRTPDGKDGFCKICGQCVRISPSLSTGDATCPNCGVLLWLDTPDSSSNLQNLPSNTFGNFSLADLAAARGTLMNAVSLSPSNEMYRKLLNAVDSKIASQHPEKIDGNTIF